MANSIRQDKQNYQYTRLADLKPVNCNVFGVVKFLKPPEKSKGPDWFQVLSLTDDSLTLDKKLVVNIFCREKKDFPDAVVGDVIRFHRLQVQSINDQLKGRPGSGFSWLLVKANTNKLSASSKSYTYGDDSRKRVRELQEWAKRQTWLKYDMVCTPLSEMVPDRYYNLMCQVVATAIPEVDCFLARVWDGSRINYPILASSDEMKTVDTTLLRQARDLAVDIWIFNDHISACCAIQPGHFIRLTNVHTSIFKGKDVDQEDTDDGADSSNKEPVLELCLHKGTAFKRGITIITQPSERLAVEKRIENYLLNNVNADGAQSDGALLQRTGTCNNRPAEKNAGQNQSTTSEDEGTQEMLVQLMGLQSEPESESDKQADDEASTQPGCSHWSSDDQADGSHDKIGNKSRKSNKVIAPRVTDARVAPEKRARKGEYNTRSAVVSSTSMNDGLDVDQSTFRSDYPADERDDAELEEREQQNANDRPNNTLNEPCGVSSSCGSTQADEISQQNSTEICMLQTASVITGHQQINHTPIHQVLRHTVPSKFRVLAHIVDFHPKTVDPLQFVHLLCPRCFHLKKLTDIPESERETLTTQVPKSSSSSMSAKIADFLGGRLSGWYQDKPASPGLSVLCPSCSTEDETVHLELTFILRMVLQDSKGDYLLANLWREEAVTFLQGESPELVLQSPETLKDLMQTLNNLCLPQPPQDSVPPKLDCCLYSYNTSSGVQFHIFDTVLV